MKRTEMLSVGVCAALAWPAIGHPAPPSQGLGSAPHSATPLSPQDLATLARGDMPPTIPPKVLAALAPFLDAMDRADRESTAMPPATSDRERLARLGRLDQAGRSRLGEIDLKGLEPRDRRIANDVIAGRLIAVDRRNLAQVLAMIPPEGWFSYSRYGHEAADAAFHIVQHGDLAAQVRILPRLKEFAKKGEADPMSFAKMYDRVADREGKPQRYGTQFSCGDDGRLAPLPMEDVGHVDARRRAIGLKVPYLDTLRTVELEHASCW